MRGARNGLRVRWESLAFWAMFATLLVLANLVRLRPQPSNFGEFEFTALGSHHSAVYRYRPVDYLYPAGLSIPIPHARSYEADGLLLEGQWLAAAEVFEQALQEHPTDSYSRLLAASLWSQLGQDRRARDHAQLLIEQADAVRAAQLLWHYLDDRVRRPSRARTDSFLHALVEVATDPHLVTPVHTDLLHDMVRDRVLTAARPTLPDPPADPIAAQAFALLRPGTPRARLWECLEQNGTLALHLLALNLLGKPANEAESYRMLDALARLTLREPQNSYWDYLAAEVGLGTYRALGSDPEDWPQWSSFPNETTAVHALQDSLRKPGFDPHVTEVHQLAVSAQRRARIPFPELHVPPPRAFLFLGDVSFPGRLAADAVNYHSEERREEEWTMLHASARLLTHQELLCQNPFGGEDLSAYYRERFLMHPVVEEQAAAFLPLMREWRPLPVVPARLRLLQRYLLHPLPIPSLVEDLSLRYAGQLDLLAKDLQLAWNRR